MVVTDTIFEEHVRRGVYLDEARVEVLSDCANVYEDTVRTKVQKTLALGLVFFEGFCLVPDFIEIWF